MSQQHSVLPRFSSFAGLQGAADAAGLAFVGPAELDDPVDNRFHFDWRVVGAAGAAVAASATLIVWLLA